MIPILSLQPLVENAVKHGVAMKGGPGRVAVRAHCTDGFLRVTIEDKSLGVAGSNAAPHDGFGLGLANVRRRLKLSYGPESELEVAYGTTGSMVTLVIPSRLRDVKVAS